MSEIFLDWYWLYLVLSSSFARNRSPLEYSTVSLISSEHYCMMAALVMRDERRPPSRGMILVILIPKLTETLSIARERSPLEYSTVSLIGSENSGMITVLVMWEGLLVSSCGLILAIVSRLPLCVDQNSWTAAVSLQFCYLRPLRTSVVMAQSVTLLSPPNEIN